MLEKGKNLMSTSSSKPIKVLISVPCSPYGDIAGGLADFLVRTISGGWPGMILKYDRPETKWPMVRNLQFKRFLEISNCDWVLLIDSDIIPPANILDMVKNGLDFCSAICFSWQFEEPFAVCMSLDSKGRDGYNQDVPNGKPGLYERDATGLACTVISRRLAKEFQGTFRDNFDKEGMLKRDADFDFCERIKASGFKVYVDTRFVCDHRKKIGLKRINDLLVRGKNA